MTLRTPHPDQIPVGIVQKKNRTNSGLVGSSAQHPIRLGLIIS